MNNFIKGFVFVLFTQLAFAKEIPVCFDKIYPASNIVKIQEIVFSINNNLMHNGSRNLFENKEDLIFNELIKLHYVVIKGVLKDKLSVDDIHYLIYLVNYAKEKIAEHRINNKNIDMLLEEASIRLQKLL